MDIPDLDRARWRDPGDSVRLRMRLAGRIADLHMTLVELRPPALARRPCPSEGRPDASSPRVTLCSSRNGSNACWGQVLGTGPGFLRETQGSRRKGTLTSAIDQRLEVLQVAVASGQHRRLAAGARRIRVVALVHG